MKSQIIIIVNTQKYIERITPNSKVVLSTAIFCFVCRPRINNNEEAKHHVNSKGPMAASYLSMAVFWRLGALCHSGNFNSCLYIGHRQPAFCNPKSRLTGVYELTFINSFMCNTKYTVFCLRYFITKSLFSERKSQLLNTENVR